MVLTQWSITSVRSRGGSGVRVGKKPSEFRRQISRDEPLLYQDHGRTYFSVSRTTHLRIHTMYASQRAIEVLQPVHSAHVDTKAATVCKSVSVWTARHTTVLLYYGRTDEGIVVSADARSAQKISREQPARAHHMSQTKETSARLARGITTRCPRRLPVSILHTRPLRLTARSTRRVKACAVAEALGGVEVAEQDEDAP